MNKPRILLKLSGGNLKTPESKHIFSNEILVDLASQIKQLSHNHSILIVVGGGNIFRGHENVFKPLDNSDAHVVGMLSTMINAVVIQNYLKDIDVPSIIFSPISCSRISEDMGTERVNNAIREGKVVIFGGGTGVPYVSTDTCAAVRALEYGVEKIFVGKNAVKGIYDSDPKLNPDAIFFPKITYEEVIERRLGVMDLSSMYLLQTNSRPQLIVFNQDEKGSFVKALEGKIDCSIVY